MSLIHLGGAETEKQMSIMKKGGHLVSLRAVPNGAFAKRMKLPKWKQMILGIAGRKFDKMADKYGVLPFYLCGKQWRSITRGS